MGPTRLKSLKTEAAWELTRRIDLIRILSPKRMSKTLRNRLGIPADVLVLGFVGRIVQDKGVVELAAAWRKLRLECENVFLLIIGPAEPQDPVPAEILQEFWTDPRVIIVDFVHNEDMPRVLSNHGFRDSADL